MSSPKGNEPLEELFVIEASQLIEQLERSIIICEKQNVISLSEIEGIFRIIHTIKGSSALMAYEHISTLSHAVEDLFAYIRGHKDKSYQVKEIFDLVLSYIDFIKVEIDKIENHAPPDGDAGHLTKRITSILQTLMKSKNNSTDLNIPQEIERYIGIHVFFESDADMEHVRSHLLLHSLRRLITHYVRTVPDRLDEEENARVIREKGLFVCFSTKGTKQDAQLILSGFANIHTFRLKEWDTPPTDIVTEMLEVSPETATKQLQMYNQNYINVHQEKLNILMDLVGELVTAQAMVTEHPDLKGLNLKNFRKAAKELEKLVNDLRDTVVEIRTLPLSVIFQRMHRIIRDISKKQGKEIEFTVSGEDTQVDKSVSDVLSEPVMHLIRNAVDHGIESQEQRSKAGKSATGNIKLCAWQNSNYAFIEVADDGRGLDKEEIFQIATQMGLTDKPMEALSQEELYGFIMSPGYTTNTEITDYSGRGVGMDVVKKSIESVGGDIQIKSELGKGTSFIIRIPLTLLIINVMYIQVGDATFAVPIRSISEAKRANIHEVIKDAKGNELLVIGDCCYPIIRLHRLFGISTDTLSLQDGILLIVEGSHSKVCLFADRLEGEQQVVVKPLPKYIQNTEGFSGCSILNDGSLSLILDVNEILSFKGD